MQVTVHIDALKPHRAKIIGADKKTMTALDRALSFELEGSFFMRRARGFQFDGRRHLFSKHTGGFPTGLLGRALEVLTKRKVKHTVQDGRSWGLIRKVKPDCLPGVTLAAHQVEAVRSALVNHGGILHLATNAGKTECACALLWSLRGQRALWLVPNRVLLKQTAERIEKRLGIKVGRIGGGKFEPAEVTIAIANSLVVRGGDTVAKLKAKRMRDYLKTIKVVIADEVHHAGSTLWYRPLSNCPSPWRIGLSGTPLDRTDGKNMMVEAICGPVVARVTSKELIAIDWSAETTVEMIEVTQPELPDGLAWADAYKLGITQNTYRNDLIAKRTLAAIHDNKPTLILCREIDHVKRIGESLEALDFEEDRDFSLVWSGCVDQAKKLERFESGMLHVMIASPLFGEGFDLPGDRIRVLINAEGLKSTILTLQKIGRGQRKKKTGKNELRVIDFADLTNHHLARHSVKRISDYEAEGYLIL